MEAGYCNQRTVCKPFEMCQYPSEIGIMQPFTLFFLLSVILIINAKRGENKQMVKLYSNHFHLFSAEITLSADHGQRERPSDIISFDDFPARWRYHTLCVYRKLWAENGYFPSIIPFAITTNIFSTYPYFETIAQELRLNSPGV